MMRWGAAFDQSNGPLSVVLIVRAKIGREGKLTGNYWTKSRRARKILSQCDC